MSAGVFGSLSSDESGYIKLPNRVTERAGYANQAHARTVQTRYRPDAVHFKTLRGDIMHQLQRIMLDPAVMGGKPCIRGMRITVGTVVGLLAAGHTEEEVLKAYPYLEKEDLREALAYAAWRAQEIEVPLGREYKPV